MRNFTICTPRQAVLGSQIIRDKTDGIRDMHGEKRKSYRVVVGKSEGKRPLRTVFLSLCETAAR
jgi:hypothetical protein